MWPRRIRLGHRRFAMRRVMAGMAIRDRRQAPIRASIRYPACLRTLSHSVCRRRRHNPGKAAAHCAVALAQHPASSCARDGATCGSYSSRCRRLQPCGVACEAFSHHRPSLGREPQGTSPVRQNVPRNEPLHRPRRPLACGQRWQGSARVGEADMPKSASASRIGRYRLGDKSFCTHVLPRLRSPLSRVTTFVCLA